MPPFHLDPGWIHGVEYDTDLARGYESYEDLFSSGTFEVQLGVGESITLAATIDGEIETPATLWKREAKRRRAALPQQADLRGRCALAADDFLYEGPGARTGVLAGFPWFGEWGRDTFIALPGLTLARGDLETCARVLSGARAYLKDGLLPNIFGSSIEASHYGSVDASLWFARAVLLYERAGGSAARIKREYLPALIEIATCYRDGTAEGIQALGIHGDDGGLLVAGSPTLNPHMDGRQLGWRGCHAPPRLCGRDLRSVVFAARVPRGVDCGQVGAAQGVEGRGGQGAQELPRALLVEGRGLPGRRVAAG